jgi:hypothetical protein
MTDLLHGRAGAGQFWIQRQRLHKPSSSPSRAGLQRPNLAAAVGPARRPSGGWPRALLRHLVR